MADTATDLRTLAQELEDDGITGAVLCVVAANEIDHMRSAEVLYKREIMAADASVDVGGKTMMVPSNVKQEIEVLRACVLACSKRGAELLDALTPFARAAASFSGDDAEGVFKISTLRVRHLRAAAAALKPE